MINITLIITRFARIDSTLSVCTDYITQRGMFRAPRLNRGSRLRATPLLSPSWRVVNRWPWPVTMVRLGNYLLDGTGSHRFQKLRVSIPIPVQCFSLKLKLSVWPVGLAVRQTSRRSTCVCLRANRCCSILSSKQVQTAQADSLAASLHLCNQPHDLARHKTEIQTTPVIQ